eukprot:13237801-Ditylum_brightwellii.AAC.1
MARKWKEIQDDDVAKTFKDEDKLDRKVYGHTYSCVGLDLSVNSDEETELSLQGVQIINQIVNK